MDTPAAAHPAAPAGRPSCCRSSPCSCCRSRPAPRSTPMKAARRSWRNADWSSTGSLPAAAAQPEARVLIMSGRTGGWKGVFSVHSWVVLKPRERQGLAALRRGRLGRSGADQRLVRRRPLVRQHAAGRARPARRGAAEGAIPKIEAAIKSYNYANAGDYRIWPGPNSNTFVADRAARDARKPKRSLPAERGRPRLPRPALCRPDRQRHRRRGEPVGRRRRQARLGRGRRDEFARPRRRPRPAPSRRQAAGLRPHRLAAATGDRRPGAHSAQFASRRFAPPRGDAAPGALAQLPACTTRFRCSSKIPFPAIRARPARHPAGQCRLSLQPVLRALPRRRRPAPHRGDERRGRRSRARVPRAPADRRRSTSPAARPSSIRISAAW